MAGTPKPKKAAKGSAKKETKAKKAPTVYQLYMKKALKEVKAKKPNLSHKEAFTEAAKAWKNAPENPNKGK